MQEVSVADTIIDINHVYYSYGHIAALTDVTFQIKRKTLCSLVGPNGSGKSTLIKCITGLLTPDKGTISISTTSNTHQIGYVEQRHFINNDFPISVREVVASGRVLSRGRWLHSNAHDRDVVLHAIESVGLSDKADTRMDQLSGGQQQRVLIAKAFAIEPDILILDEPTAGVDTESQKLFRDALQHIIEEHNTTVVLVSHELSAVADLVDQIVVLKNTVLFDDTPEVLKESGVSLGMHEHDLPLWLERMEHP